VVAYVNSLIHGSAEQPRNYSVSSVAVPERNLVMIRSVILARVLAQYGFTAETKLKVPEMIWRGNEECVKAICGRCSSAMAR
jgi:ribonucleoside-diphosphate reductase alpha chain